MHKPNVNCQFLTGMNENIAAGVRVDSPAQSHLRETDLRTPERVSADTVAVAFLFPGLGGERFDRFTELAHSSAAFNAVVARADVLINRRFRKSVAELIRLYGNVDQDVSRRLFRRPAPKDAPPTDLAQCLLYVFECALARAWIEWGVHPHYVMGYSLGEYSAACIAGLFTFESGLSLVMERAGLLMSMPGGAMIAVSAACDELQAQLEPDIHVVAENSPTQTILGGEKPAIERAARLLRERGYLVQVLPVELAFHTPLMKAAGPAMERLFSTVPLATPTVPLISTLTGDRLSDEQLNDPSHWGRHLCEPVQFRSALHSLARAGARVFLEVGPGQALSSMVDLELRAYPGLTILTSMPAEFDVRPARLHLSQTARVLSSAAVAQVNTALIGPQEVPQMLLGGAHAIAPEAGVLSGLQQLWSSVLQVEPVGADDNLFDLGGNSLRTARIAMQIKRDFGIDLSLRDIYSAPTPRRLAGLICAGRRLIADGAAVLTLPNGVSVRCPSEANTRRGYQRIFEERTYLRNGIRLAGEAVVVDVGADIGLFSIFAALQGQQVELFSLEPDRSLFEMLRFNMADVCEEAVLLNEGVPAVARLLQSGTLRTIDLMRMDIRGYDIGILDTIPDEGWRTVQQVVIEIGARSTHVDAVRTLLLVKNFGVTVEPHHCGDSGAGYSFFALRREYDNARRPQ